MAKASQAYRETAVSSPLGEDVLLFRRMQAHEELGRLFELHLELLSERSSIAFKDLLGKPMTVSVQLPDQSTRYFSGFVTNLRYLGVRGRYSVFSVTLRPWLWFLTRTADCRIFQEMSVPDIIKKVFRDFGFSSAFKESLSGTYKTWDYCVQYRETAFDFVSRLMELEGIYYYFTHEDGNHTLVLSDDYSSHKTFPGYATAVYIAPGDRRGFQGECVSELVVGQAVQTGKVALNAFDFEAPTKTLKSATPAGWDYANGTYEVYDYPGNYTESGDGDHYSRVFMEELAAQQERVSGSGNVGGLAAGSLITLQRHPLSEQNREYLVLSTDYRLESDTYESTSGGDAGLDVEVSFVAQDAKRPYRSERLTPKPMVRGPQTAIVVGKSGEEIWTDKYGRIKVQFHWDRYSESDEKSSCWIRVAHPWAGKTWGAVAVPRIGQEVVVSFLEGDPDRPLVVGSVYNGDQMPPYTLPDNKTQSGVKSRSTKGAGTANFNELRFEDKKGGEDVYFHAEKDFHRLVENDDDLKVQNKQTIEIKQDRTETITDGNETVTIKKGNRTVELSTGNDSLTVKQGNRTVKINMGKSETEAMQSIELKVGQSSVKLDQAGVTIKGITIKIEGQAMVGVKGLKTDVNGDAMLTLKGGITMIN